MREDFKHGRFVPFLFEEKEQRNRTLELIIELRNKLL